MHNDLVEYVQRVNGQIEANRRAQAAVRVEQGRRAQMVVDSPGWSFFQEHLQGMVRDAEERRAATVAKMTEGDAVGDALTQLKVDLARLAGEIRALHAAADAIPQMIQRGKEAAEGR